MEVDEARRDNKAGRIDAIRLDHGVALAGADARDPAVDNDDVGDAVTPEGGVDHAPVVDRERAHAALPSAARSPEGISSPAGPSASR